MAKYSAMKNVLIIGHNGFIGKKLSQCLQDKRDYCVFTSDFRLQQTSELENFILKNKVDTIVHLVSDLIPASNEKDFTNSLHNVIIPTYKLIDIASENNIQFVFLSSGGAVYGRHDDEIITESSQRRPINYYGFSKLMIEDYILLKNKMSLLNYLILRPSNVYGEGQDPTKNQGFIAVALRKIYNNEEIVVWGDGKNSKNYIYVDDVVLVIEKILQKDLGNSVFNVCSDKNISLNEIISVLAKIAGVDYKVAHVKSESFDVMNFWMSNDFLKSHFELNFTSFETGINKQIEFQFK